MTATVLLTVVGVALVMEAVGLSAALGSFIAGALLADSEYRHQIEADIVRALGDGTLAAASLDVFQVEPLPADSPLWSLDNAYLTPHIGAISNPVAGVRYFSQIIRDHEAGKPLPNVVDRKRGY